MRLMMVNQMSFASFNCCNISGFHFEMPDLEWYHEQQLFHNEKSIPLQNMTCKHIWSTLFQKLVSWLHRQNCKAPQAHFWSKGALIMIPSKMYFLEAWESFAEKANALQWIADCKNNSSERCKSYLDRFTTHQTLFKYIVSQFSKWIWMIKSQICFQICRLVIPTSFYAVQLTWKFRSRSQISNNRDLKSIVVSDQRSAPLLKKKTCH